MDKPVSRLEAKILEIGQLRKSSKSSYDPTGSGVKPRLGDKSTIRGLARPGQREARGATADSVASVNGKVARPGFHQKAPKGAGGRGTIARPGGPQGISGRGVNK